jgi:homoserine dehydrogenase
VADIMRAAHDICQDQLSSVGCTCYEQKPICPLEKTSSCYYVRLLVDDEPGVLAAIATAFGEAGVSLKSVIQTRQNVVDHAEIVAITHKVLHEKMQQAMKTIRGLKVVDEVRNIIRVENGEDD